MNQLKKRERATNFARSETRLLTELVCKHRLIIENKKTDSMTNKKKEATWTMITAAFNSATSGIFRAKKTLKLKYESLKKCTKRKARLHRQEFYRTGGKTPPPLDELEEKVLAMCSDVSGLNASSDSDIIIAKEEVSTLVVASNGIPRAINIGFEEVTLESAAVALPVIKIEPLQVEEVMTETNNFYRNENDVYDSSDTQEILRDSQNKWDTRSPKLLKSKVSQPLKLSKVNDTPKLDQLSAAQLELVQLQKEIANKEHLFIREEHELKMQHLRNEESRKQELHELMMINMKRKNPI